MATTPTTTSRNPAGRTPDEYCRRGHVMAETRRRRSNGDTYCLECKQARARRAARLVGQVARMERLLRDGLSTTSGSFQDWQRRVWQFFESVEVKR